jgi:hypothetical protein
MRVTYPIGYVTVKVHDIQPNVRQDGREVVFSSNRPGSQGQDIGVSSREAPTILHGTGEPARAYP